MRTPYELALGRELAAVGISGRLRRRILAEIADHLACDPGADLGEPRSLARQFADVMGTARAKTAAVAAFAGLVVAGALFAVAFFTAPLGLLGRAPAGGSPAGVVAAAAIAVATQVAFVAGLLAALRWVARRGVAVLPAAEAVIIVRRAAVGVGAGIVSMAGLATIAVADRPHLTGPWSEFAVIAGAVGTIALLAAVPSLWTAVRLRPRADGPRGDMFDDLGPLVSPELRGRPWRLAVDLAFTLAVVVALLGVGASDGLDGVARGIVEALACLGAFATLGRYLGLWAPEDRDGGRSAA